MLTMSSKTFLVIILLIESATLSSAGKTMLNVITDSAEHRSLSQAVTEIIRSLEGDTPSAMAVIKVTSHDADAKYIDLFTETIVRNINGLFEFHIQDYDKVEANMNWTRSNALLIVPKITSDSMRRVEQFLLSWKFELQLKLLVVFLDKNYTPLESDIKLLLDLMWRKFIVNVHVVSLERNGDVTLNTYFPYTKDFCGQVHPVVWDIYRNNTFLRQRDFFPRKNDDFFQCALHVAVFNAAPYMIVLDENGTIDVDGVDGRLLETISSELNFSINYIVLSEDLRWGEIYANQTATGATELVRFSRLSGV